MNTSHACSPALPVKTRQQASTHWIEHPNCPPAGARLCAVSDIPATGGFEVQYGDGKNKFRIVLLREGEDEGENFACYLNFCPHFSIPLNYREQDFLTLDGHVVCAHHNAFFRIHDGACVEGPCTGATLVALPFHRSGETLYFGHAPHTDEESQP